MAGLPYTEVVKRKYPIEKIIGLIHNPDRGYWPDYATLMPPLPNISQAEALEDSPVD